MKRIKMKRGLVLTTLILVIVITSLIIINNILYRDNLEPTSDSAPATGQVISDNKFLKYFPNFFLPSRYLSGKSSVLTTKWGLVYHKNCNQRNSESKVVVFLPGGRASAGGYKIFVRDVGDETGLCVLGIPYDTSTPYVTCCGGRLATAIGGRLVTPILDKKCFEDYLSAQSQSNPSSYTCINGGEEVKIPYNQSIEGLIKRAFIELNLKNFLENDGVTPIWSKVFMAGHSLGGLHSGYFGMAVHELSGIGLIGSGTFWVSLGNESFGYPDYWTGPSLTDISNQLVFDHLYDPPTPLRGDQYGVRGMLAENIITTNHITPGWGPYGGCKLHWTSPGIWHNCVAHDSWIPFDDNKRSFFLPEWLRLIQYT